MAGAIVSASMGVMGTLLPKLSMLIQAEYKLQKGVKTKIAFLKNELSSMESLLVKLANNEERLDEQLKDWRNNVRELSYDIEDCIDLFIYKMSKGGDKANLVKKTASKIKKIWSRRKIDKLIDELKARVVEESGRRLRYKVDDMAINFSKVVHIDPRLPALYVEAKKLVGIEGPREKIIDFLKNDDNGHQLKVVSIVGFGGLGKTTLANQVYQKIKGQFDRSCFVPVSRNPNVAKILANMHKELQSPFDPSDDERQLIDKLRAFLQDKRYFIIVDDIWNTQAWELIKSALPENNLNSRVITTTRISNVGASCCTGLAGYVHNIQPLSDLQSQQLFSKRVFGDTSACPPHLAEITHRILEKCHGLPLAIISIASLLAGKSNKDQWEQVYTSLHSAFSHQGMREILLLSYYDLPHHLKTCFLYLSIYPEDYKIYRVELTWRWIAEGFITEVRGKTVEQTAESYFNELVNRSLIQPIDIQYDGRAKACRVHDMVLELILSLSAEENFACIVEGQSYSGSGHKIRRLSVQSEHEHVGDKVTLKIMDKLSQVRSISLFGFQEQITCHLQELHHLRVLFVQSYYRQYGNQHIKYIGSLLQLKFLVIDCGVTELPEDIGNLRCLQTLNIRRSGITELPRSIGHLQKLVSLLVNPGVQLPDEIGELQALEKFQRANIFSVKLVEALGRLTKLKTLRMGVPTREELGCDIGRYEEALKSFLAVMGNHGLQSLEIFGTSDLLREEHFDLLCSTTCLWKLDVYGNEIARVPKQMSSLVNLTYLSLGVLRIKQEDLCIIGGIPALLIFILFVKHAPDERLTIASQQFQCLKEFMYFNRYYGGGLEMLFLQDAMLELRRLHLEFRVQETESKMGFEFIFEHLARLEHIGVRIRTEDATRSRVEAAEAAVRSAVSMHPGRPTLDLGFWRTPTKEDKDERDDSQQV